MIRGILCVVAASVLFGITPLGNKYVVLSGMSAECIVVWQQLVMIAASAAAARLGKNSLRVPRRDALKLVGIGLIGIGGTDLFLNLAYGELQVSSVLMIHFLYPTFVLVVTVLLFKEAFTRRTAAAVVLCLAGLVLVTGFSGNITLAGALYALGSGIAYGTFVLANDRGGTNRFPLAVKLFYTGFGGLLVCGVILLARQSFSFPADDFTALMLFGIVGAGSFLGFYLLTAGIKYVGAATAAYLNMLELLVGVFGGILLYGDEFSPRTAAGGLCILLSVALIAMSGRQAGSRAEKP